jgi:cytochrome bd-type quinol oxidase subunit 2
LFFYGLLLLFYVVACVCAWKTKERKKQRRDAVERWQMPSLCLVLALFARFFVLFFLLGPGRHTEASAEILWQALACPSPSFLLCFFCPVEPWRA